MSLRQVLCLVGVTFLVTAGLTASANAAGKADVLLLFDTTGSMGGALNGAKAQIISIADQIDARLGDAQFAVAELRDYPNIYGAPDDFPWRIVQSVTDDRGSLQTAVNSLQASGGGDGPESYGRAMFEADVDTAVGWRPATRRLVVLVADNLPHDDDVNEGIPEGFHIQASPYITGPDPGRDAELGTDDDLDWQSLLARLRDRGLPLMYVLFEGAPAILPYWQQWTAQTGGAAATSDDAGLSDTIVDLAEQGATGDLPPCPEGQVRDVNGVCGDPAPGEPPVSAPPASTAPPPVSRKAPVVLVGGLGESNPRKLPSSDCTTLADFRKICEHLTRTGHPVYVIAGSKGAPGPYELDNAGGVRANASKLAAFIRTFVPSAPPHAGAALPPLIVGHSMGGLIAHTAISDYGALAGGLFTIGTPHTGSYGADLALGISEAPCPPFNVRAAAACLAVKAAAGALIRSRGADAMRDLTSRTRQAENRVLRLPGVTTWAFAGTPCTFPFISDPYWSPNDGIVGLASAHGRGARLGEAKSYDEDVWHTVSSPLLVPPFNTVRSCDFGPKRPNQFTDPKILNTVAEAAGAVSGPASRNAATRLGRRLRAAARSSTAVAGSTRPARVFRSSFALTTATGRKVQPGSAVPSDSQTMLASKDSFSLTCGGKRVPAIRLFDADVYSLKPRVAECSRARLIAPKTRSLMITQNRANVRATLTMRGRGLTLSVAARAKIHSATLRVRNRRVTARTRRRGSRRLSLTARLPARAGGTSTIEVVVGNLQYAAFLPHR